jgi:hypothetical protein
LAKIGLAGTEQCTTEILVRPLSRTRRDFARGIRFVAIRSSSGISRRFFGRGGLCSRRPLLCRFDLRLVQTVDGTGLFLGRNSLLRRGRFVAGLEPAFDRVGFGLPQEC